MAKCLKCNRNYEGLKELCPNCAKCLISENENRDLY